MNRSRVGAVLAGGAIAVGAMLTLTAPAANAKTFSEETIQTFCHVRGGTYYTHLVIPKDAFAVGTRYSTCHYTNLLGHQVRDDYTDGKYTGTSRDPLQSVT